MNPDQALLLLLGELRAQLAAALAENAQLKAENARLASTRDEP